MSAWTEKYLAYVGSVRRYSERTVTIYGDVVVTVDSSTNAITLSHLAVGSHGKSKILSNPDTSKGGNTKLILKGNGANLSFTENGELWGGCSGDSTPSRG